MLIGILIGGTLAIYLLAALWEWAVFKRITNDPVVGKTSAVAAAWVTAGLASGLLMGSIEAFFWAGFAVYVIPSLIVGIIFYRRGVKIRNEYQSAEDIAETFR